MILKLDSIVGLYIPDELAAKEDVIRAIFAARIVSMGYNKDPTISKERFIISFDTPVESSNGAED